MEPVFIRAASILTVKSVAEDRREIEGIASNAEVDRQLDIVEPRGVKFKNPTPLLWQHDHTKPVGKVWFTPGPAEIRFKATLPKIEEPGTLRDRVEEAWQSIKARLVTAVSIGFRALEHEPLPGGGTRFIKSELIELSLVTIPAHPGAVITSVKSIDNRLHKMLGTSNSHRKLLDLAIAAGDFERVAELGTDAETLALLVKGFSAGRKGNAPVPTEAFATALAGAVEHNAQLFRYASARITALEKRLTDITARSIVDGDVLQARIAALAFELTGIELARRGSSYAKGDVVRDLSGNLWRALQDDEGTEGPLAEPTWRRISLRDTGR